MNEEQVMMKEERGAPVEGAGHEVTVYQLVHGSRGKLEELLPRVTCDRTLGLAFVQATRSEGDRDWRCRLIAKRRAEVAGEGEGINHRGADGTEKSEGGEIEN